MVNLAHSALLMRPRKELHQDQRGGGATHGEEFPRACDLLLCVDTAHAYHDLINARMAYVSVSRARCDAHIYTNDAQNLGTELGRDVSKRSAIEPRKEPRREVDPTPLAPEPAQAPQHPRRQERYVEPSHGFSMER
jgi:hypothetical protein